MFYTEHTIRKQMGFLKWKSTGSGVAWFHEAAVGDGEEVS